MTDRAEKRLDNLVALDRDSEPSFHRHGEGYRMLVPASGVTLEIDYLRRDGSQLKGELLARAEIAGARTVDGVLDVSDLNLSSARARAAHAKHLAARANAKGLDFETMLADFALRVLSAERAGDPAVWLHEIDPPGPAAELEVLGWPLLAKHPVCAFGDGGSCKSYLALYVAGVLAQRGIRVGVADWELAGEDHRDRLDRLFGEDLPQIAYIRCARPLTAEVDRIRRIRRELALDYLVLDSVAFACDGPAETQEVAARFFQALRSLGELGTLLIAHITKSLEGADRRPFGSTFWHNGARATWNVKPADGVPDDTRAVLALHNRKANLGRLRHSIGIEFRFEQARTHVRRIDLGDEPDLAAGLPTPERLRLALRRGPLSRKQVECELEDVAADTLRKAISREKKAGRVLEFGDRLSLAARGAQ
jgi:hypothetical protein